MTAPENEDRKPPGDPPDATIPSAPGREQGRVPGRIGRYTIKRKIASGGMGTIFEGFQEEPRRPVAVKVLRRGVASPEALRRFRYESQILARLRHPGIAQVYEAGTYEDGDETLPFFAMEYIANAKPITEFADSKNLGAGERLQLFARVCDAVHFGHQKGIIHRDLKPSNILVDSHGFPRVIDFGVARATDSDLALATLQTEVGQIIGSLQYMSPEQFDADPHDIDTRSDVYALGLVLYELLAGTPPYDLSGTAIHEAARTVREQAAPRLGAASPELRGDVETIVQKALEKDRDQRYQSAFGLAQDIRRSLAGDSITARPPSVSYQIRVFARRHKAVLATVAAAFAVLVAGVVASTTFWLQAEGERVRAEEQSFKAEAATEFMRDMLTNAIPRGFGDEVTIAQMLDLSREKISDALPDEPEVEADVCSSLGWGYLNLARYRDAESQWKRALALRSQALGRDHPKTLESLQNLAICYRVTGQFDDGLDVARWIRESTSRVQGEMHDATLTADHELAVSLCEVGHLEEAENVIAETIRKRVQLLGDTDPATLNSRVLHAGILLLRGDMAGAEEASRLALADAERTLDDSHLMVLAARSQMAAVLIARGDMAGAGAVYDERPAFKDFGIRERYQGEFAPESDGTQVLVFWETWCPFSARAVPLLEPQFQRYRQQGVEIVGVTTVSRSATDESVRRFIAEKGLSFPIVRTDDRSLQYYNVEQSPSVRIVRDGHLIWENHLELPDRVPAIILEGLAQGT